MGCICVPPTSGRSLTDVCKIVLCNERLTPPLPHPRRSTGVKTWIEMSRELGRRPMLTQRLKMLSLTLVISVVVVFGAAAQRVPKGQVVVALGADVPALDPHMHNIRGMLIVGWQLFDNLISRDPTTMKPVPHLAESWRLVDELTWEFQLRHGVKFHNGESFTAATVKYNVERVLNPDQNS